MSSGVPTPSIGVASPFISPVQVGVQVGTPSPNLTQNSTTLKNAGFAPLGDNAPIPTSSLGQSVAPYQRTAANTSTYSSLTVALKDIPLDGQLRLNTTNIYEDKPQKVGAVNTFLIFLTIIFLLATILPVSFLYSVAYGVIEIDNPEIKDPINRVVQQLPFIPQHTSINLPLN